ncbi:MAG: hypothetical protein ACK58M_18125 [Acidobacteriota bacterium]|jgi:hypothetical protein|nr:hypothetical protein [Bryobacteraceae bacterium CoA2 C42]MCA2966815.1 hypothetical protein [Acidobacteriaceae bacterium]
MTNPIDQNPPAPPAPETEADRAAWTTPELQKLPVSSTNNFGPTNNPDGSFTS